MNEDRSDPSRESIYRKRPCLKYGRHLYHLAFECPPKIAKRKVLEHITVIAEKLGRLISWRRSENGNEVPQKEEPPLRSELFNVEQLERHAMGLAASHHLDAGRGKDKLIARLNENESILVKTYELVMAAAKRKRSNPPAAEWLLDNFYLIEEKIRMARRHLPPSYSRELPRLKNGPAATYPRVYGIALDLISHVDGHLDSTSLTSFLTAYQSITPLKLGELWAVPIMLRLALIENLRRVADACRSRQKRSRFGCRLGRTNGGCGRAESDRSDTGDGGHGPRNPPLSGSVSR